jgi:hypothetical protein
LKIIGAYLQGWLPLLFNPNSLESRRMKHGAGKSPALCKHAPGRAERHACEHGGEVAFDRAAADDTVRTEMGRFIGAMSVGTKWARSPPRRLVSAPTSS